MAAVTGTIRIAAPIEHVFDTAADSRHEPSFNPSMTEVELLTGEPVGLGTRFRARMSNGMDMVVELTEFDRPHRIGTITRSSLMETAGTLSFASEGGGTLMRWDWQVRPKGWFRLLGPFVGPLGRRMERRIWTGLKHQLEAASSGDESREGRTILDQVSAAVRLRPDFVARSVRAVTPDAVRRLSPATRALCFDVDGTITDYHASTIDASDAAHLRSFAEAGFSTYVISNCYGARADELHTLFDPLVTEVFTPADCVDPADPADHARRHRKPAPDMVLLAASRGSGTDAWQPTELLVVGDQLLKDVAAARAAGTLVLLVPRLGRSDHLGVRLLQRPLETLLRGRHRLPVRRADWPDALTRA